MNEVSAGVGGESGVCYRFRPELVANLGFVTGLDRSWWRIWGLLPVQAGVGGESEVCYRFRLEFVVISGFFGTGWPIWLQVRLLFPEIATIPHQNPELSRFYHQNCIPNRLYPGFVTGEAADPRISDTGVGGESGVCYRFRPELVANPGFVTGSGRSWWRIRGLLPV